MYEYNIQGFEIMSEDNVNKLFTQFKNKYVSVDLRGDYQTEGKIIAIDNYLNLVLENENGLETIKGGNVIFISVKE
jgi:small nuclear ribonucleoprotein (snRNP)-like protein